MQVTQNIAQIDPLKEKPSEHPQFGQTWWVQGSFRDGSQFQRGAKSFVKAQDLHKELTALIGQDVQYDLEDTGKEYQGHKKFKLLGWPGKPERPPGPFTAAGGTRGTFQVRYRDTKEGFEEEGDRIARSVALQQAVALICAKDGSWERVLAAADPFYAWLVKGRPVASAAFQAAADIEAQTPVSAGHTPPAAPAEPLKAKCPNCGATESVRWSGPKGEFYCWKKLDTELFDLSGAIKKGCGHTWKPGPETAKDKYIKEIASAKDIERLKKLFQLISSSKDSGSVSQDEEHELQSHLERREKELETGKAHSEWHDGKVRQAQQREIEGRGFGP